jgi:hypothetical protein
MKAKAKYLSVLVDENRSPLMNTLASGLANIRNQRKRFISGFEEIY